jgi:hypothetical protein
MTRVCGIRSFVLVNPIDPLAATLARRTGGIPADRASWHVRVAARASQ